MSEKRTFYTVTEDGTTIFRTKRRVGDVRIPNYVYDIWQPIIGAVGMGVYGTYCRLEMSGAVKGLSQAKLAKICRIGTRKLASINEQLEECGFITIRQPEGHQRLMHYTTEITVYDPPHDVSKEIKDKYAPESGYEILTPWLEAPALSNGNAGDVKQQRDAFPNDNANVVSLGLHPLGDEAAPSAPTPSGDPVQHNLDEVIEYLEGTGHRKEELQAQCPYCQAPHAQDINTCPDCGVPVIWLNSTIWKRKFGKPAEYIRKLKGEDLKPVTPLQVEVAQVFGSRGEFQNVTQQRDVIRLEKKYPYGFITKMLYWANDKRAPFSSFVSACNNTDNLDSWKQEEGIQEKEVVIVETKSEPVDHQPEIPEFDDLDEWLENAGRKI